MTTETTTETAELPVEITDAMHAEGIEITKIVTGRSKTFKGDIADTGWVVRLGKLMLELEALAVEAGRKRVSSKMIKDAGLNKISSAIRSEAKWFVDNIDDARSFIKASKTGFTNVSALKTAMAKAAKATEKDETTEGDSESETTETAAPVELCVPQIVFAIQALASRDGKSVEDVLGEIVDLFAETDPVTDVLAA
mgnify:CR=1 FL=1